MGRNLRVLHVEDQQRDVALLTRHLARAGYELVSERVDTPDAMRSSLEAKEWDVILCDYSMPQFSALGALELLKTMGLDIPFIIISGTIGEELAVEAMRAGAHDYLMKDKLARLVPTIERELQEVENRRARQRAEEALRASEERYRDLVENAHDIIYTHDLEGNYTSVNAAGVQIMGYTREEVLKMNISQTVPPESLEKARRMIESKLIGQEGTAYELEVIAKGGHRVPVEVNTRLNFQGGVPVGVQGIARDITERKRAEAAVRESQARLAGIVDSAMDAIITVDSEQRILLFNRAAEMMFQRSAADALGRSLNELIPERFRNAHVAHVFVFGQIGPKTQAMSGARSISGLRSNGEEFPAEASVSQVETGGQKLYTVILRDVSERKRAEEALRESEERYRLLFESNPLPMWVYDLETLKFLAVNEAAVDRYGYSREEFMAMTIADIRPREDLPTLLMNIGHVGRGGLDKSGIWRHRKKDGQLIEVEVTSHMMNFAGRDAEMVLANDVTERRLAEAALKKAEERYRSIFENAVEGIFQSSPAGQFIAANPALVRILGFDSAEDLMAHRADIGTQHYVEPSVRAKLTRTLEEHGVVVGFECEVFRKDGTKLWVVENIRAVRDESGAILNYEGSIEDITERKSLEEQLRQSQKLEAVGQLAGGVAHDFNNLLTVINGYSDMLLRQLGQGDPARLKVEEVKKAGERAAGLTRQLLAFSRKQVLQPKVLNLNTVVTDVDRMLRRLIGEDVDLLIMLHPSLGYVRADPGQIEQVMLNLAVNARDAMPQGGKLTIETSNVYLDKAYANKHIAIRPGNYVMLAVSDTGCGMNAETQARIFEPFFTTKEKGKGTGLGLSTVYGIVKQSGGNIWVYSEVGYGTTFKVYLPRVDEEAEGAESEEKGELPSGRETLLLVEDEEQVRRMTRTILESGGYKVLEARGGSEALSILSGHKGTVDLVMTDVVMPEMSGPELAHNLMEQRPGIKVLFMSGYTDDAIVRHGLLGQELSFLQKPFTADALMRKVREVLDTQSRG